jgi:hypothetical protein
MSRLATTVNAMTARGYDGPLSLEFAYPLLDAAVKAFGDEEKLSTTVRYHDAPVWFVGRKFGSDFFQQVEVAIFKRESDLEALVFLYPLLM